MGQKATTPSKNLAQIRRFCQRSSILNTVASPFYTGRNYNPVLKTLQIALFHLQLDESLGLDTFGTSIFANISCHFVLVVA